MEAKPKLLQVVRDRIRAKHYSYRTEHAYVGWIRRFVLFNGKRHPRDMGAVEVESFLTHLAVEQRVSASTQNQALGSILFFYREVLNQDLPWIENVVRARRSTHLPVVLARREVQALLAQIEPQFHLIGQLLYGSGLRLMEALRLRVKDVDFDYSQVVVRDGKGQKDRVTILPDAVAAALQVHLRSVRAQLGRRPAPPSTRAKRATRSTGCRAPGRHHETRGPAHVATLLRHALARARLRHPHRAGAHGSFGRAHDADLHARDEERCRSREEPARLNRPYSTVTDFARLRG